METRPQFTAAPTAFSGLLWHFSDTRTELGRVRFLLEGPHTPESSHNSVLLYAEGPGWSVQQSCSSLNDAILLLAWLPELPYELYAQALSDVQQQQQFYGTAAA